MTMRVLIIGGTGFIGPYVVRRLRELGHEVTLFHRGQTADDMPSDIRQIHGDRRNLEQSRREFAALTPDAVLDMFPFAEQDARSLVDVNRGIAGRVVAISSQDVYRAYGRLLHIEPGPPDPTPLAEDAPLRERLYPYRQGTPHADDDPDRWQDDYDKIPVERVILGEPDLPGTILRLPMVYGPRDEQHRTFEYLKRMDDGRPAILLDQAVARWRWTRGYVENVADAIALTVTQGAAVGRVYNVGEPEALTMAEWVAAIGSAAGWQGSIVAVPAERLPDRLRSNLDTRQDVVTDSTRIRQELGYTERVSREEALARTIAWQRANPPRGIAQFDYAAEDAILAEPGHGEPGHGEPGHGEPGHGEPGRR
jgi:nucleoside-diphosphate-sugar epimerase